MSTDKSPDQAAPAAATPISRPRGGLRPAARFQKSPSSKQRDVRPGSTVLRAALADELVAAALALRDMLEGAHLDEAIDHYTHEMPVASARAVRNMAYDATRQYGLLSHIGGQLNRKPPVPLLGALQALGVAQLIDARRPVPVIIDQTVRAVNQLPEGVAHPAAAGFMNATLRRFVRERDALIPPNLPDEARYNHPGWWVTRVRQVWPDQWEAILAASLDRAPLSLRANRRLGGQDEAARRLEAAGIGFRRMGVDGLVLEQPMPVEQIPGFAEGLVSVQDLGAQCAAQLLDPQPGERILDACAAPGGKTAHLLEMADCEVWALDIDPGRASIIMNNLQRSRLPLLPQSGQTLPRGNGGTVDAEPATTVRAAFGTDATMAASDRAAGQGHWPVAADVPDTDDPAQPAVTPAVHWGARVMAADAADPDSWWDGQRFDRILLDAPCSASGIVRRHPDVLWHRQRRDIATFSGTQARLIEKLWPLLRPGGTLLYATCSIFPEEGEAVVSAFVSKHPDCQWQRDVRLTGWPGWPRNGQLLPTRDDRHEHDGFFYALLSRHR